MRFWIIISKFQSRKLLVFRISFLWSFLVKSSPATVEFRLIGLGGCVRHQDLWRHHFRFPFFFREKKKEFKLSYYQKNITPIIVACQIKSIFSALFFFFLSEKCHCHSFSVRNYSLSHKDFKMSYYCLLFTFFISPPAAYILELSLAMDNPIGFTKSSGNAEQ